MGPGCLYTSVKKKTDISTVRWLLLWREIHRSIDRLQATQFFGFCKNSRGSSFSAALDCSAKSTPPARKLHSLFSWVSSIRNGQWMGWKWLVWLIQRVQKMPWCCCSTRVNPQVDPRVWAQNPKRSLPPFSPGTRKCH